MAGSSQVFAGFVQYMRIYFLRYFTKFLEQCIYYFNTLFNICARFWQCVQQYLFVRTVVGIFIYTFITFLYIYTNIQTYSLFFRFFFLLNTKKIHLNWRNTSRDSSVSTFFQNIINLNFISHWIVTCCCYNSIKKVN